MKRKNEFYSYATKHIGISSQTLDDYIIASNGYISPTIIEEQTT